MEVGGRDDYNHLFAGRYLRNPDGGCVEGMGRSKKKKMTLKYAKLKQKQNHGASQSSPESAVGNAEDALAPALAPQAAQEVESPPTASG